MTLPVAPTNIPVNRVETRPLPEVGGGVIRIFFPNGWGLSLAKHRGAYSDESTVEVALINPNGELDYTLHYDVWGYQTQEEVEEIARRASAL